MEAIIIFILQLFFELLLNIFLYLPSDWGVSRRSEPNANNMTVIYFAWFLWGCTIGVVSLIILYKSFISSPELRIANLFIAPLVSGYVSKLIAEYRAKSNSEIKPIPIHHFWWAFWFTVGVISVRFAYAVHA